MSARRSRTVAAPHLAPSGPIRFTGLLWAAIPLALYVLVLRHLWFNAPIWDDYDAILNSAVRLRDALSPGQWLERLVFQHNEHRIVVVRMVGFALAALTGAIDIRVLVAIGNLTVVGILLLAWAEYRAVVAPPLFAAAGFLLFQWSYYEASLMGSAALPNIGVVFFSFACLFFSLRGGAAAGVACALCGLLAAGSQANGLFALPMAAAASAFAGRRARGGLLAALAVALWAAYFIDYARPPGHPSMMAAFENPLAAAHLFTIIIGGLAPIGALMLAFIAWLTLKGAWKAHPTAALWIGFLLLSAAAATVGRVGFGVFHASRYAIYSSALVMIVFLAACAATRPWKRSTMGFAILAAAVASFAVTWGSWPRAVEYSRQGRLLAKVVESPGGKHVGYVGMLYPSQAEAAQSLRWAEERGLYTPPERVVGPATLRTIAAIPAAAREAGFVDHVLVVGRRVHVVGWTDVPSSTSQRVFSIFPAAGLPSAESAFATPRPDVARIFSDRRYEFAGFALDVEYPTDHEARLAAQKLCVLIEAPGYPLAVLHRPGANCRPGAPP